MPKDTEAPSFPFYPDDFVSDGKVEAMTTEEVGAYLLLICKAWRERPAATVPNDDRVLARWARLTPERWAECKAAVMSPWKLLSGDLRWQQPRLKKEHEKMLSRRRFNHGRANLGAAARWGNASSMLKASPKHSSSKPQAMPKDALPIPPPVPKERTPHARGLDGMPIIPEPLQIPEFQDAWARWLEHRRQKRAKLTPLAAEEQLRKCEAWGIPRAVAAINHSIGNGWQGLFEPTNGKHDPEPSGPPRSRKYAS